MPNKMLSQAVQKTENQCIHADDQKLALLDAKIEKKATARKKLNAGLRKLRAQRKEIIQRRELTDAIV